MKNKTIRLKRKRQGKTNYKKRLAMLKSKKNRLVIRKSLNNIIIQIIEFDKKGDKVIVKGHSSEIKKLGWKFHTGNIPCAYLTGYLLGTKAKKEGIKEVVLDIGLNTSTKGSRLYASLKGFIDSGMNIKYSEEILPDEKKINGEHIKTYFEINKKENKKNLFNRYIKSNLNPQEMDKVIEQIKNKLNKG